MGFGALTFVNSRLSIAARLALLSALFLIPIVLLLDLFIGQSWREISFAGIEIDGSHYLSKTWPLMAPSAAAPQDKAASAEFDAARAKFDSRFHSAAWSKAFVLAPTREERLREGGRLISVIADASNITLDPDLDTFYLGDATSVSLPQAASAEADLESAAGLPASDPERQARVAEALQRIMFNASNVAVDFDKAINADPSSDARRALSAQAHDLAAAVAAIEAQKTALLMGATAVSIAEPGRALQQQVSRTWSMSRDELERLLSARVDRLLGRLLVNLLVVAVVSVAALTLAAVIAMGAASRMAALVRVMERLAANEADLIVPHLTDRDEIGRIAQTVEAFKRSLIESRQAWAEVLFSEARYRLIADFANEMIVLTDLKGAIVFASPSVERFGYTPDGLEGRKVWDLWGEEDAEMVRAWLAGAAGEPLKGRHKVRRADGAWSTVGATITQVRETEEDGEDQLVFCFQEATET